MSQDFKLKFDEMREGKPTDKDTNNEQRSSDLYDSPSNVRNLCFAWPDGRMKFLNYAYLVSGDYLPEDRTIILVFTADKVFIKGTMLSGLFQDILCHLPCKITCIGERYKFSEDDAKGIIESIEIMPNV